MADVKWIKVSTDMFESSRKIKQIEVMPEGDTILVIWLKLLLLAGNVNDGGSIYITPEIPYTDEMLAHELRRPLQTVRLALSVFVKFGMIEIIDDILRLSSWEKYQNTDKLAEIRAKDRERKRLKKAQSRGELPASTEIPRKFHGNSVDVPHIEEEREEDKEKEIHSFTHSRESEEDLSDPEHRRRYLGGIGKDVVFLSDEQMSDLLDKLSVEEFDYYVGVVAENELKGHHYKKKTHYQAILDMANRDRRVKG